MEIFDKPPFKKASQWSTSCCFAVISLLISSLLLIYGITETLRYNAVKNEAVSVIAVGRYVREEEDSDGDTYYQLMVGYDYAGKKYCSAYRRYSSRTTAEAMLGKKVTICINPSYPLEQLSDIASRASVTLLFGSLIFSVVLEFAFVPKRKWYVEVYGLHKVCLEKDIWRKHYQNISQWLGHYVVVLVAGIIALIFKEDAGEYPVLFILFWGWGTLKIVPWLKDTKTIRQGKFRHSIQTLVNKKIEHDDSDEYVLYYSDGNLVWPHKVSKKEYKKAQLGETVNAVFLEGRKKPHLVYDFRQDKE